MTVGRAKSCLITICPFDGEADNERAAIREPQSKDLERIFSEGKVRMGTGARKRCSKDRGKTQPLRGPGSALPVPRRAGVLWQEKLGGHFEIEIEGQKEKD